MSGIGSPAHRAMVVESLVLLAEGFKASMDGALDIYPDISDEVYRVLQDRALARTPEFQQGLQEMLEGLGRRARARRESAGETPRVD